MAELTAGQRQQVTRALMRAFSNQRQPIPIVKADLLAAVSGLDTWTDGQAAAINAAIPQPARGALNPATKAVVFNTVQIARYIVGNPTALAVLRDVLDEATREVN